MFQGFLSCDLFNIISCWHFRDYSSALFIFWLSLHFNFKREILEQLFVVTLLLFCIRVPPSPFLLLSKYYTTVIILWGLHFFCTIYNRLSLSCEFQRYTTVLVAQELFICLSTFESSAILFFYFMSTHIIMNYEYSTIFLRSQVFFKNISLISDVIESHLWREIVWRSIRYFATEDYLVSIVPDGSAFDLEVFLVERQTTQMRSTMLLISGVRMFLCA